MIVNIYAGTTLEANRYMHGNIILWPLKIGQGHPQEGISNNLINKTKFPGTFGSNSFANSSVIFHLILPKFGILTDLMFLHPRSLLVKSLTSTGLRNFTKRDQFCNKINNATPYFPVQVHDGSVWRHANSQIENEACRKTAPNSNLSKFAIKVWVWMIRSSCMKLQSQMKMSK